MLILCLFGINIHQSFLGTQVLICTPIRMQVGNFSHSKAIIWYLQTYHNDCVNRMFCDEKQNDGS